MARLGIMLLLPPESVLAPCTSGPDRSMTNAAAQTSTKQPEAHQVGGGEGARRSSPGRVGGDSRQPKAKQAG